MIAKRPDGWSWIRNFHICWTRVQTMLTVVRTVVFELRFLPYKWARPDRIHVVRTVASIFPYLNLERKSEADRSLDVVRTGCWDVRTDARWNISFTIQWRVQTKIHIVRTNDAWSIRRPDGMAHRPDGWNCGQMSVRTGWHVVRTAGREPKSLTCTTMQNPLKHFWIVESLLKSLFTYKWFCPIRMRPISN
jgi:hypothetical protein